MAIQVGALEALVELGCDAKVKDSVASTPMHVAAGEGHLEAILKLVDLVCIALPCLSLSAVHHRLMLENWWPPKFSNL